MNIQNVTDPSFRKYGRILEGYDLNALLKEMEHTPLDDSVIYVPSVNNLEALAVCKDFSERAFGGMPIQIGYCNGKNVKLNALEYHTSSEIDIAVTDLILMIGAEQDITEDYKYDTAKVEAFLVPAGTAVELYATTLHYAPANAADTGFKCVVILPKGTNTDFALEEAGNQNDKLLFARNKWLIAHEEGGVDGAYVGLVGENITL